MKNVLLLGAGLVARPLVNYLLDKRDIQLTILSKPADRARHLLGDHPRGKAYEVDATDKARMIPYFKSADVVISLLPASFHPSIAKLCLQFRTHLITASYLSEEMIAMDKEAQAKGLLFLNEIGLDPGIDHMSAMKIRDEVVQNGGRILSFESCCGGLPAPDANDNPFGYKFSWSPKGVLLAGKNPARYRKEGQLVTVAAEDLFDHHWPKTVPPLGEFEVYPNRDALSYEKPYRMHEAATFFRGTFRYPGWCETIRALQRMNFLSGQELGRLNDASFAGLTLSLIGRKGRNVRYEVAAFLHLPLESPVLDRFEWLGLFSEAIPVFGTVPIDILTQRMLEKMAYRPNERDMVLLQHEFLVEQNRQTKRILSTLIEYGEPAGDSAMARTVSLPVAIAANLLVHDRIDLRGVVIPAHAAIYKPVLAELNELGIKMVEREDVIDENR